MRFQLLGLASLILICGAFGGYAGYLLTPPSPADLQNEKRRSWWICRAIVLGIVAAMLVPLFLRLGAAVIGTEENVLMGQALGKDPQPDAWFVLAGFFIVAAASAQRFVTAITDTVLKQLQRDMEQTKHIANDAKSTANDAKSAANELGSEVEDIGEDFEQELGQKNIAMAADVQVQLPPDELSILQRMSDISTSNRRPSPEDIARISKMEIGKVRLGLAGLQSKGLVQQRKDALDGSERWRIRTQGKALLNRLGKPEPVL
jgi:YEATS-Like-Associating Three TM